MRKAFVVAALFCAACGGSGGDNAAGTPTVATPTFSVPAGTKNAPISVTIATTTTGAVIHCTTNGVDPTAASTTCTTAIDISSPMTLKAIGTAPGYTASAVATAAYAFQAATPTFSVTPGTYTTAQSVALTSATPGATIYYTTNGTDPTTGSSVYAAPISLSTDPSTTTLKALAVLTGFTDSGIASGTYTIDSSAIPAATPTFSPPGGTYTAIQNVTIASTTGSATIYYTIDGTDPTVASSVYSAPVPVAASRTLKAIAIASGHPQSAIGSATYTIDLPQAATPTFSPAAGSYFSNQLVTISSTTPGAVIRYTTDGVDPTADSTTYASAISVSATTTVKAIATATGYTDSAVASATYTITGGACSGTDSLSVCNCLTTKLNDLSAVCLKINPAIIATPDWNGPSCADSQKEIAAGLVAYDATQGALCASDASALTCASLSPTGGARLPASCLAAFSGQVGSGGACYESKDCANGYCTAEFTLTCPGTCQPLIGAGGDCTNGDCAAGLVCFSGSITPTPTCGTPVAEGADCSAAPCQDGFWCDRSLATPVCKAPVAAGATCSSAVVPCVVGYQCLAGTCQALSGAGEPCTSNPCGFGFHCSSGTCVSDPTAGQACSVGGPACIGGFCNGSGSCVAGGGAGAVCSDPSECQSFSCSAGHCDAPFCVKP